MKVRVGEYFSNFFLDDWELNNDDRLDMEFVDAKQFLCPNRFDLIAKIYYIDCRENGKDLELAKLIYKEHIRAFSLGTFTEPGTEEKNTIEKYFSAFDELIDDIKENGFNYTKSIVPVGENGSIIDGSHRVAIAWYYNLQLPIVRIANRSKNYNYEFFKERGLDEKYLNFMSWLFVLYSDNSYVACLWPRAYSKNKDKLYAVDELISKTCGIIYRKEIKFNYHGIEQLMMHIYGKQPWAGSTSDGYKGIPVKARNCYGKSAFTTVYVLPDAKLDTILRLKAEIRELFQIENHSIHITDTKEEVIEAAQMLLFPASIELLNYGQIIKNRNLADKIIIHHSQNFSSEVILNTQAVKALYGLRTTNLDNLFWQPVDKLNLNIQLECGYVFGEKFLPCNKEDLSTKEKVVLTLQKFKYGSLTDTIINFRPKERIRHLGGRILRKFKIIK